MYPHIARNPSEIHVDVVTRGVTANLPWAWASAGWVAGQVLTWVTIIVGIVIMCIIVITANNCNNSNNSTNGNTVVPAS